MSNNLINMEYEVARNDFATAGCIKQYKKILVQLGINPQIVRRTAIVTYEAEMNLVIHSIGGKYL